MQLHPLAAYIPIPKLPKTAKQQPKASLGPSEFRNPHDFGV